MDLVTIKTYIEEYLANLDKNDLEAAGIQCFIKNATAIAANPFMTNALGGFQLQCKVGDAKQALEIINRQV